MSRCAVIRPAARSVRAFGEFFAHFGDRAARLKAPPKRRHAARAQRLQLSGAAARSVRFLPPCVAADRSQEDPNVTGILRLHRFSRSRAADCIPSPTCHPRATRLVSKMLRCILSSTKERLSSPALLMHSMHFRQIIRDSAARPVLVVACLFLADAARADDAKSINGFRDAIVALGPDVDPAEAELVSVTSHNTARRLQKEWRVAPLRFSKFSHPHRSATKRVLLSLGHGIGGTLQGTSSEDAGASLGRVASGHSPRT